MPKYVGLTDDPDRRKGEHGNPADWKVEPIFQSEIEARKWERDKLKLGYERRKLKLGYKGGPGGDGWRYGYTYTITPSTME